MQKNEKKIQRKLVENKNYLSKAKLKKRLLIIVNIASPELDSKN
jgi:hypothetical protein